MHTQPNDFKRHELWDLRHKNPAKLIATYRRVANMEVDETLPLEVTFDSMIDAIVRDHGQPQGKRRTMDRWR